jgi:hypothetical protein
MADEPSYPDDAPVGAPAEATSDGAGAGGGAPLSEAAEAAAAAKASSPNRTRHIVTGAAIGIGSAALVAALLYARSSRRGDRRDD